MENSGVDISAAADAKAARAKRSQEKNARQSESEKLVRHRESAALVLEIISSKDATEWKSKARGGNFEFQVLKEEISFSKFAELVPKTHLPGLKLLMDKVFLDCHDEVLQEKKDY